MGARSTRNCRLDAKNGEHTRHRPASRPQVPQRVLQPEMGEEEQRWAPGPDKLELGVTAIPLFCLRLSSGTQ